MAPLGTVEVEQKFDADASTQLPALEQLEGIGKVGEPASHSLEAIYFDTRHLALGARGITLRRRTGGPDAGWHLKLPHSAGRRTEIQAPLGSADTVPVELMDRVIAYTRGHAVAAVATLNTERTSYSLYGNDGRRVADFVDDHVRARSMLGEPRELTWREWEVELAAPDEADDADDAMLSSLTKQLSDAGAKPSERTSKLATALGDAWPASKRTEREEPSGDGPAAVPVLHYVDEQVAEMLLQDSHVRLARDDSVHQMRSQIRRIRAVLHGYRALFEPDAVKDLERELKSLAKTLGRYRDVEVLHERLKVSLDELPGKLVLGQLGDELEERMTLRATNAMAAVRNRLNSPRYFTLLDNLETFLEDPPLTSKGSAEAKKSTAKLVNKAGKRLCKRHDAAVGAAVGPERDKAFHEVRKAAKKLRFAAAAVEAIHGKRAVKLGDAAHRIQSILGDHQDSVMARAELLKLGSAPGISNGAFTYGVLHAMERTAADATLEKYLRKGNKARKLRLKK
ncbi:CYTH and CHAD domain-containing protein [Arthrobacter sp. ISL-95]|uniref:CYTH and CHAD domain-containing protein n=1 Tax=Arthrobacter sp. ISL-95 TaxID=2819116 RepID=UPI001BE73C3A|nr:CYTH and CHAD domain-containing protein [Arthrobacter sp. ISL-95]MBT2586645.1 CYTH and CHAD domain-containing protein [Arthrobacter sp. ISL-95]